MATRPQCQAAKQSGPAMGEQCLRNATHPRPTEPDGPHRRCASHMEIFRDWDGYTPPPEGAAVVTHTTTYYPDRRSRSRSRSRSRNRTPNRHVGEADQGGDEVYPHYDRTDPSGNEGRRRPLSRKYSEPEIQKKYRPSSQRGSRSPSRPRTGTPYPSYASAATPELDILSRNARSRSASRRVLGNNLTEDMNRAIEDSIPLKQRLADDRTDAARSLTSCMERLTMHSYAIDNLAISADAADQRIDKLNKQLNDHNRGQPPKPHASS